MSDLPPQEVEKPGQLDVASWRVFTPVLDADKCIGCMRCYILCPEVAIEMVDHKAVINYKNCKGCGVCTEECPVDAIDFVKETI
ncbi:4Fe-4S binding protein [Candidatus Bathyarchaeota archaeon]|nr:4Fe-4S binding protein [Candidatus Bathyarchaeota archaeon]